MIIIKIIYLIGGICFILGSLIYLFFRHQRRLKARAFLMREAVRNGDYEPLTPFPSSPALPPLPLPPPPGAEAAGIRP